MSSQKRTVLGRRPVSRAAVVRKFPARIAARYFLAHCSVNLDGRPLPPGPRRPSLSMRRARLELTVLPRVAAAGREGVDSAGGADVEDGNVTATAGLARGRTTKATDEAVADGFMVFTHRIG